MSESENLSTKLFKPQIHAKETSTLIGALNQDNSQINNVIDGKSESNWYRILRRPLWSWLGLDPINIEQTLARIAVSKNNRSHEELLDTVIGYRPGNWNYEWSLNGAKQEKIAKDYFQQKLYQHAARHWLKASNYYSIAAYPYLKGDSLSLQSETLATKSFSQAIENLPYKVKTVSTQVDGKKVEGFLFLPHTDHPLPTVIFNAGFEFLQTDCWRVFEKYFLPANIAVLTLDMPSIGKSAHWQLTQDSSKLHQAMLNELKNLPWVDHFRVGCFGLRLGANAAVRLAFVEPSKLKSCVSVGGILHSSFYDLGKMKTMTAMQMDCLASRMGKDISSSFLTHLQVLSLKNQGLLGGRRTSVPILALGLAGDPLGSEIDNQLAARFSQNGKSKMIPSSPLYDAYHRIMLETIEWFTATL